ncbi:Peptide methionine sulfoxide reductase MsrA/MsrB, partial [Haemophilus influenzae]
LKNNDNKRLIFKPLFISNLMAC